MASGRDGPYKLDEFVPGSFIRLCATRSIGAGVLRDGTDGSLDLFSLSRSRHAARVGTDCLELLPTDAELLAGNVEVTVYQVPVPGTPQQFFFNTRHAPLDNVTVRQALIYGTNRTEIIDAVYQGRSPIAHGPLTSTVLHYDPEVEAMYPFDLDQARALLASQGLQDLDNNGILEFEASR